MEKAAWGVLASVFTAWVIWVSSSIVRHGSDIGVLWFSEFGIAKTASRGPYLLEHQSPQLSFPAFPWLSLPLRRELPGKFQKEN